MTNPCLGKVEKEFRGSISLVAVLGPDRASRGDRCPGEAGTATRNTFLGHSQLQIVLAKLLSLVFGEVEFQEEFSSIL